VLPLPRLEPCDSERELLCESSKLVPINGRRTEGFVRYKGINPRESQVLRTTFRGRVAIELIGPVNGDIVCNPLGPSTRLVDRRDLVNEDAVAGFPCGFRGRRFTESNLPQRDFRPAPPKSDLSPSVGHNWAPLSKSTGCLVFGVHVRENLPRSHSLLEMRQWA
jgi:hypothetical protein